jgi:hypothetical protein
MTTPGIPLRCPSRQWGIALPGATGQLDVLCREKHCRVANGGPVRHVFDLTSGSFETFSVEPARGDTLKEHPHAGHTTI